MARPDLPAPEMAGTGIVGAGINVAGDGQGGSGWARGDGEGGIARSYCGHRSGGRGDDGRGQRVWE